MSVKATNLLQCDCSRHGLSVVGYCLMSNHVHLVVVPSRSDSMALALRHIHGRYAAYLNARQTASGHVWQGRFYSCPLDTPHLWATLRYTERNPVRAGIAVEPELYAWSSASVHCGFPDRYGLLDLTVWRSSWTISAWRAFLADTGGDADAEAIRKNTHTGRPLGDAEFVHGLERALCRPLAPKKGGRPSKQTEDSRQTPQAFAFE